MLINNDFKSPIHNLRYTSQADATLLSDVVDKPSACAGFLFMQLILDFKVERWEPVKGYNGRYMISNMGRIISYARTINGKQLALILNKDGYIQLNLSLNNNRVNVLVHRLVANAFIANPLNLPQVNHLDGDKTNNSVWNLEWSTSEDNIRHAWKTGLATAYVGYKQNRGKAVKVYFKSGVFIAVVNSFAAANRITGISIQYVKKSCEKLVSTGNYLFKYYQQ